MIAPIDPLQDGKVMDNDRESPSIVLPPTWQVLAILTLLFLIVVASYTQVWLSLTRGLIEDGIRQTSHRIEQTQDKLDQTLQQVQQTQKSVESTQQSVEETKGAVETLERKVDSEATYGTKPRSD